MSGELLDVYIVMMEGISISIIKFTSFHFDNAKKIADYFVKSDGDTYHSWMVYRYTVGAIGDGLGELVYTAREGTM